ncbi:MAG: hypothetical protein H6981_11655 [Gammaproteobacteria bacterium]|nr:hypothetical protein [Gammaproteobacteria bacterium]MCP5137443.1 hypothetical protein [Gammaproteobacteria bacterium]
MICRPLLKRTLLLLPMCLSVAAQAETEEALDDRTGLPRWDVQAGDVRLRLVQRLPDQTRAFFLGRGFDAEQVDRIAGHCVLQTILYNDGHAPIELDMAEWSALVGDREIQPRLMSDWQQEWQDLGVADGPRIAFRWALFPNHQRFSPGDWNMGMTTWPATRGASLDVRIRWHAEGVSHELTVEGVRCP